MLKSERVILRPVEREDLKVVWQLMGDVELNVGAAIPVLPFSLGQVEARYEKRLTEWPHDLLRFAIEVDGAPIGICELREFDNTANTCVLGILIGKHDCLGKGFGREAVGLLLDYGFRYRNVNRIWLTVTASNERAIRCYLACGMVKEGVLRDHAWTDNRYEDMVVMAILRREWEERLAGH